jgi:hypothetical protein
MALFEKGFIGPIGDDLPSLIPIVTGLVIFFSVFVLTMNTYNEKNDYLEKQIDMTSVARDLTGDSLILNWSQFNDRCTGLKIKRYPYSFITAIYGTDVDLTNVIQDFKEASLQGPSGTRADGSEFGFIKQEVEGLGQQSFYCNYLKIGGKDFSTNKREYSVRFYPIAVQQPIQVATGSVTYQYLIVPAVMAMVVWE